MESGGAGIESLEAGNGGFTVAGGKAQGFSVRRKGSESAGRSQRMPDSLRERGRHGGTRRDAGKPCAIVVHSSAMRGLATPRALARRVSLPQRALPLGEAQPVQKIKRCLGHLQRRYVAATDYS